jgi:DnaJ-class molecular chaperone
MKSHYEALEVSPHASHAVIRAAYRCLAQIHHPDKNRDCDHAGQRLMIINCAHSVLSDPATRRSYDLSHGLLSFVERRGQSSPTTAPRFSLDGGSSASRPFAFRPLL